MRLLLTDFVRRQGTTYLYSAIFLTTALVIAGYDVSSASEAFGISMCVAYFVGAQRILIPTPRPVSYLPLSQRDVWRAKWLYATVTATAFTAVVKVIAMLVPRTRSVIGLPGLTLSILYDFAYTGMGCGLTLLLGWISVTPAFGRRVRTALLIPVAIAICGGMFWAFLLRSRIDARWSDLSAGGLLLLGTAIGVATGSYFLTPPRRSRWSSSLMFVDRRSIPSRHAQPDRAARFDGITGIPRLLWNEYVWMLTIAAGMLVLGLAVALGYHLLGVPSPTVYLRNRLVLLFDGHDPAKALIYHLFPVFMITVVLSGAARFDTLLRQLRTLPLGSRRLNALLMGWPAIVWLSMWLVLFSLHWVLVGRVGESLQSALLLAVTGCTGLSHSLRLRWPRLWAGILVLACAPFVVPSVAEQSAALASIGLGALALAAFVNQRALQRSASYRNTKGSFAVPMARRY